MKFTATLLDGRTLTEVDFPSVALLPREKVVSITITNGEFPPVTIQANVVDGEQIYYFVRNIVAVGNPGAGTTSIPVYEIRKDTKTLCRLYLHPEKGPLLTTQDLYFS